MALKPLVEKGAGTLSKVQFSSSKASSGKGLSLKLGYDPSKSYTAIAFEKPCLSIPHPTISKANFWLGPLLGLILPPKTIWHRGRHVEPITRDLVSDVRTLHMHHT